MIWAHQLKNTNKSQIKGKKYKFVPNITKNDQKASSEELNNELTSPDLLTTNNTL